MKAQSESNKTQLGVWGSTLQAPRILLRRFELPKLVLRLTCFNRFIQRTALVNTSLTTVGRLFDYLFHLSSCMLNGENINRH